MKFLGFDGLYQRGIFGYLGRSRSRRKEEIAVDETEVEKDLIEDAGKPHEEDPGGSRPMSNLRKNGTLLREKEKRPERRRGSNLKKSRKKRFRKIIRSRRTRIPKRSFRNGKKKQALTRLSQASLIRRWSKKSPTILKNRIPKAKRKKRTGPTNRVFGCPRLKRKNFLPRRSEGLWIGGKHGEFTDFRKRASDLPARMARAKAARLEVRRVLDKEFDNGIESHRSRKAFTTKNKRDALNGGEETRKPNPRNRINFD